MEASFIELQEKVISEGLFRRTKIHYAIVGFFILCGFGVSLYAITLSDNIFFQIGNAIFFAFLTVQAGMLGHDFSHQQVFDSRRLNTLCGMLVWGLVCGLSQERWYERHNAHHKYVNHQGRDPELTIPFIFSSVQTETTPSFVKRYIQPHQHVSFFLLVSLASLTYIFWSCHYLLTHRDARSVGEGLLMFLHFGIVLFLLFSALPVVTAFAFLAVFFICAGYYMGFAFAPNHKGMDIVLKDTTASWTDQITLTRNLHPSRLSFYFFGGLGYQIEHHLFPSVARFQYPKIALVVKAYCSERSISYHETSWSLSLREIYEALRKNRK